MTDEFKQMVIDILRRGDELPREWARELFPPSAEFAFRTYRAPLGVMHSRAKNRDIALSIRTLCRWKSKYRL